MSEVIKFLKIRNVKSPNRAFEYDAGIDFFVPKFEPDFIEDLKSKNPQIFDINNTLVLTGSLQAGSCVTYTDSGTYIPNASPKANDSLIKFDDETSKNYFEIPPHSRVLIPAGIKSRMSSPERALIAANKSGIASKKGLIFGAQVVDYTYKGEIHISIINTSNEYVQIFEDMKIIQFLEMPVFSNPLEVTENLTNSEKLEEKFYKGIQDDRKSGGFGHTDNK